MSMSNPHRVSVLMGFFISDLLVREHRLVRHVLSRREGRIRVSWESTVASGPYASHPGHVSDPSNQRRSAGKASYYPSAQEKVAG
jgi:hypothetical protein